MMNRVKRVLSLLLALVLLVGNVPAAAFATEETVTETVTETVAETVAPTERATEPAKETVAPTVPATEPAKETVAPTVPATEPAEETIAPTLPAVPEETSAPTEAEKPEETVPPTLPVIVPDPIEEVAADGAVSGSYGTLNWTLNAGTLTVTGTGKLYTTATMGLEDYESDIQKIIIGEGITEIGKESLYGLGNLVEVRIPNSVTRIGEDAFADCFSLENVYFGTGLTYIGADAFYRDNNIENIYISDLAAWCNVSMSNITASPFGRYVSLGYEDHTKNLYRAANIYVNGSKVTSLVIPSGVKSIGQYCFAYINVSSITIPDSVTSISKGAFQWSNASTINFGKGLTTIPTYAFSENNSLTSLTIQSGVTAIESNAFYGCEVLASVSFPNTLQSIGESAFQNAPITTVTIPYSVEGIASKAFGYTNELTSVYFTGNKPVLGTDVFYSNSRPNTVNAYYPAGNTTWAGISATGLNWSAYTYCASGHTYGTDNLCTVCGAVKVLYSGTCGTGINWALDAKGKLTISGSGAMANYSYSSGTPWKNYLTSIKQVVVEEGITAIGDYAFAKCTNLTQVKLPDSLLSIGSESFYNCTSLNGISLPDSLTSIGSYAFNSCASMLSISIPENVTSIGEYAFAKCSALTEITVGYSASFTSRSGVLFTADMSTLIQYPGGKTGAYTIPNGVTEIYDSAFEGCTKLTAITFPDSVNYIRSYAFSGCTGLTELRLTNVGHIYTYAFLNCSNLTTVFVPLNLRNVYANAFWNCNKIGTVYYEGTTGQWGMINFNSGNEKVQNCSKIYCSATGSCGTGVKHSFYDGVLTISGSGAMTDFTDRTQQTWNSYADDIKHIIIEDGVTSIGDYAFADCEYVESVSIGKDVKSIGIQAFWFCNLGGLSQIELPANLTTIKDGAFWNCTALTSMTIPATVTSIGASAFRGCDSMRTITFKGNFPNMAADGDQFRAMPALTVYYPANNSTWTENVRLNYGCTSTVTWTATCGSHSYTGAKASYTWTADFSKCTASLQCVKTGCEVKQSETVKSTSVVENATCTAEGKATYTAAFTSASYTTQTKEVPIPATGKHVFDAETGLCACGAVGGTCGKNLTWTLDASGKLTISGTGEMTDEPWTTSYRDAIKSVVIEDGVTSIHSGAFDNCSSLTSISIPDSVTKIDHNAFDSCSSLVSINIPDSVTSIADGVFWGCSSLTSITIPDSVSSIGDSAFTNCSSLTSVIIPDGVTSIGVWAFENCNGLTSIVIPSSVTSIGSAAFQDCWFIDVYYGGTSTQWTALGENVPEAYYIHYSCTDAENHWVSVSKDATCTTDGYTSETCACGFERNKVITQTATGEHNYVNNVCTMCQKKVYTYTWELVGMTINGEHSGSITVDTASYTATLVPDVGYFLPATVKAGDYFSSNVYLGPDYDKKTGVVTWSSNYAALTGEAVRAGAIIGTTYYETAREAVQAASATNATVKLLKDNIGYPMHEIEITGDVTIDLNGFRLWSGEYENGIGRISGLIVREGASLTLTGTGLLFGENSDGYAVENYGTLKIESGVSKAIWDSNCDDLLGYGIAVKNYGVAEIHGVTGEVWNAGTITLDIDYTYGTIDNTKGGTMYINGGTYNGFRYGALNNRFGDVYINGGTFTKNINGSSGNIYINGGTFEGTIDLGADDTTTPGTVYSLNVKISQAEFPNGMTIAHSNYNPSTIADVLADKAYVQVNGEMVKDLTVKKITGHVIVGPECLHSWDEATCTAAKTCPVCGLTEGKPLGHDMDKEWTVITSATCTEDGVQRKDCSRCDHFEEKVITASGHNYVNNYCTVCQEVELVDSGECGENLTWKLDVFGKLTISGTGDMTSSPWDKAAVKSITIEDGVTSIGEYAFYNCSKLTSVGIGNGVTSIGNYAFDGCSSLTDVYITDLGAWLNISFEQYIANPLRANDLDKNFYINQELAKDLVVPDGVTSIGQDAFYNCRSLTSITISESVTSIGEYAFYNCDSLTSVIIPDSVTRIYTKAFYDCDGLTSVTIPDSVISLSDWVFYSCDSLTNATIGNSVTSVDNYVFYCCSSLTDIVIPASLTRIGICAFQTSSNVEDVYYGGTAEQWGKLSTYRPSARRYHYESTGPENHWTTTNVDATCEEDSYIKETCACGNERKTMISGTALGHDMDAEWTVVTPATCTEDGVRRKDCSRCDHFEEDVSDAPGHKYTAVITKPTCMVDGYTTHTCSGCGDSYEDSITNALGHNHLPKIVPPTYTQKGYTNHKCSRCDDFWNDTYTDPIGLPNPIVKAAKNPATGGGTLTWPDDGEADYYEIYRKTSSKGKYILLTTVEEAQADVKVSVGKTYYYKVRAVCDENPTLNSGYSNVVKVKGTCAQPDVTVAASTSSGKPVLKWNKVTSAKKYYVYRATAEDGTYKKVKTTTSRSYTDSSAKVGVTYFYKVKAAASKSSNNSAYSVIDSCLTVCARPSVTLKIASTTGKPYLSWKAISGAVQYEILRAESADGEFTKLATQSTVTYTDLSAAPDKDYWYKVNALGATAELNSADGTAKMIHATLAKPVVTFAIDEVSGKPVLTWEAVEGAKEYKIYRSTSSTKSYKAIATVTDTEYTATSASVGKGYYYKVIAIGETAKSAYSSYKKLTAKCAQPVITVEASETSGKPVIKWSKVSGAAKYYIYRVDENGTRTSIGSTTKTYFTDSKAVVGTTYTYQVRAIGSKSSYNSIYSKLVGLIVPA